jgi:glycosyltransferase involved in cell wall biosynthesis
MQNSLVTGIIPTRNRPELALRAVRSALGQTHPNMEVIVVVDGPDPATRVALGTINDNRLRVLDLNERVGSADARNKGVQHAKGEWVAFLDDDDEWMPDKIEKQFDRARHSDSDNPVVACRVIGRTPKGDYIWPRRYPKRGEALSEYLFARNTWFRGEGQIQTSMIFTRRQLMLSVPFTSGMSRNDDSDWYVHIGMRDDVGLDFVDEPLAIWHLDENRDTVTTRHKWRRTQDWLNTIRPLITSRAYAGFIATQLAGEAAKQHAWVAFFPLLRDMFRLGKPKPIDIALYLGNWAMPESLRSSIRSILGRKQRINPSRWSL